MPPDIAPNQKNIQTTSSKKSPLVVIILTLVLLAGVIVAVIFIRMNMQISDEVTAPTPVVHEVQKNEEETVVAPATTEEVEAALGSVKGDNSTSTASTDDVQKEIDRMKKNAGAAPAPTTEQVQAVLDSSTQN